MCFTTNDPRELQYNNSPPWLQLFQQKLARLRAVMAPAESGDPEVDLDTCRAGVGMWIDQIRLQDLWWVQLITLQSRYSVVAVFGVHSAYPRYKQGSYKGPGCENS